MLVIAPFLVFHKYLENYAFNRKSDSSWQKVLIEENDFALSKIFRRCHSGLRTNFSMTSWIGEKLQILLEKTFHRKYNLKFFQFFIRNYMEGEGAGEGE